MTLAIRLMLSVLLLAAVVPAVSAAGMEGRKAPAVSLAGPDGQTRTLAGIAAGRPVVVLFWASWCPYCKALMPHLQSILDEYGSKRLEVVAIDLWEDDADDWKPSILDNGYDFQVLLAGDALASQWGVRGTPGLFLVGKDGKVVYDRNAYNVVPTRRHVEGVASGQSNGAKAARMAPLWAAELRKAIDADLAR